MVDGIMYLTQRPNDVVALDAQTGRIFWIYKYVGSTGLQGVLRREQSRAGDSRRHAVHGHARRAPRRARRDAAAALLWNVDGRRVRARLFDHARAARRQGQGDRRRRRR